MSNKTSGLGDNFYVGGYDLSGDVASLDKIASPLAVLDSTGIRSLGHERIAARRDGDMEFTSLFNWSALGEHVALSGLPRTDTIATYFRGTALGAASACVNGKQINYDPTRDQSSNLTLKVQVLANQYGLEWGSALTAGLRTDTAATAGSPLDGGAATAFGFQAYLQLIAFTGTDVTIKLQDATTSGGVYADITSGGFPQITTTTPRSARIAVGGTGAVRQFVKATTVTTGGFTSATFAVILMRNTVAVSF